MIQLCLLVLYDTMIKTFLYTTQLQYLAEKDVAYISKKIKYNTYIDGGKIDKRAYFKLFKFLII